MRGAVVGRRARRAASFVLVCLSLAAMLAVVAPGGASAAPPREADCRPPQHHQVIRDVPWHVRRYGLDRVWPLTTGAGMSVAVVDSGVDAAHPQLRGRVAPGRDFLYGAKTADSDCVGHGTGVASLIAGAVAADVGFAGLAPGARIVPVRVSEQLRLDDGQSRGRTVSAGDFAKAIRYAADSGATVMNLSVYFFTDDRGVRDAIAYARSKDIVIVAAVGNAHNAADGATDPVPYPAAYDGVVGVGAVDEAGVRAPESQVGPFVDLVAPGVNVTMAANRSRDHWVAQGTSFAAPQVAATAALVRARWPQLSADEVVARLLGTADPAPGGVGSDEYGHGTVNPYRAVTEVVSTAAPRPPDPLPPPADGSAAAAAAERVRRIGVGVAGAVVGVAILVVFTTVVLRRGRRRRWRAGYAEPVRTPVPAEGEDGAELVWSVGRPPAAPAGDRRLSY